MNPGSDPYTLLGVEPEASEEEIRARWRGLAATYHPDRFVGASPEEQARAADHMKLVNAAYEEIRSGRARGRVGTPRDTGGAGATAAPPPGPDQWWRQPTSEGGSPWIDDDVLAEALETLLHTRDRQRRARAWMRAGVALGVVLLLAAGFHLFMSQTYGYDYVWDGQGNTYRDVDCGSRYDRGRSSAEDLRTRAAGSFNGSALHRQADTIEAVCGKWTRDLQLLWFAAVPLGAFGLWWVFAPRRRG